MEFRISITPRSLFRGLVLTICRPRLVRVSRRFVVPPGGMLATAPANRMRRRALAAPSSPSRKALARMKTSTRVLHGSVEP